MAVDSTESKRRDDHAVLTVLGVDRVGIVARLCTVLAAHSVNIEDIRMALMDDLFTMIALVDLGSATAPFAAVQGALENEGRTLGVQVLIQREEIFHAMHRL